MEPLSDTALAYLVRFYLAVEGEVGRRQNVFELLNEGERPPDTFHELTQSGLLEPRTHDKCVLTQAGVDYLESLDLDSLKQNPKPPAE